ncbi:YolD-like family protein [Neobacillus sp. SuZ13]|uniref:YolD-like family protein n=1 Tax=Neobacillus sp. SuZ13 TaxID=3047875 RepID=UPI0024BF5B23|nr:YolD-like family protein [Neobacillus sp. SuZ13]WHY65362.1 YolD-like family protein [Neobacillus sp. SuZ13]
MLRDRGKIKWQSAFFMPEHVKMLHNIGIEDLKVAKPILDEYQIEEFEQNLLLAMEYTYQVKINVWKAGFINEYHGILHRLDEL